MTQKTSFIKAQQLNKKKKVYTEEDKAFWIDLYNNQKLSVKQISEKTQASKSTISRSLHQAGVLRSLSEASKLYYAYTLEDKASWVYKYKVEKKSMLEIARETKASYATIRRHLHAVGIVRNAVEERLNANKIITKFTQEDLEVWLDLYINKHLSCRQIADVTGFSQTMITTRLREKGVLRTRVENDVFRKKLTQDDWDIWVDLYKNQNISTGEIAKRLKISPKTIQKKLGELGFLKTRVESRTLYTDTDVNLWVKLYVTEKLSARQVAEKTGASEKIIQKRLRLLGVLRTRSKSQQQYTDHDFDLWLKLYLEQKLSSYEIAKITKASPSSIQVALRKFGLLRPRSEKAKQKNKEKS